MQRDFEGLLAGMDPSGAGQPLVVAGSGQWHAHGPGPGPEPIDGRGSARPAPGTGAVLLQGGGQTMPESVVVWREVPADVPAGAVAGPPAEGRCMLSGPGVDAPPALTPTPTAGSGMPVEGGAAAAASPAPALLFGATQAALPPPRSGPAGASPWLPMAGAVRLSGSRAGRAPGSPSSPAAGPPSPVPEAPAWDLVRELTRSLHVSERRQAQHAAVHLELRGELLAGTQVTLVREGHRLCVELSAGSEPGHRALHREVERLKAALAQAAPDCHVEVTVRRGGAGAGRVPR